jgi:hypothetical protein
MQLEQTQLCEDWQDMDLGLQTAHVKPRVEILYAFFIVGVLRRLSVTMDAPIDTSSGPFPVVVFSHG